MKGWRFDSVLTDMNKIQDTYGERFDYPIEELIDSIKSNLNEKEYSKLNSDKLLKAWLLTPGAMSEYYREYTDINIYKKPMYSDLIDMKKYINLYTSKMQRIISMFENETPYRISQYEGFNLIIDFLKKYY